MFKGQPTREGHNTDAFGKGTELWSLGTSHLCVLLEGGWVSLPLFLFRKWRQAPLRRYSQMLHEYKAFHTLPDTRGHSWRDGSTVLTPATWTELGLRGPQ